MVWLKKQLNVWKVYSQFIHDPRGLHVHSSKPGKNRRGCISTRAHPSKKESPKSWRFFHISIKDCPFYLYIFLFNQKLIHMLKLPGHLRQLSGLQNITIRNDLSITEFQSFLSYSDLFRLLEVQSSKLHL